MTIGDFTAFLGKSVTFALPMQDVSRFDGLFYFVSGKVTSVCINQELSQSEFIVDDGDCYSFKDVIFVQQLPNPAFSASISSL